MSTLSGRGQTVDEEGLRTLLGRRYIWPDFRDQFDRLFQQIVVSHKPDHGIAGGLHDDTRYGVIQRGGEGQPWVLRYRRKLEAVKPEDVSSILSEIIDQPLKRRIEAWLDTETPKVAARLAEQGRKEYSKPGNEGQPQLPQRHRHRGGKYSKPGNEGQP